LRISKGHAPEQFGHRVREPFGDHRRPLQACHSGVECVAGVFAASGEAFEQHQSEGVDVGGWPHGFARHLFGGHVAGGADDDVTGGEQGVVDELRDAEVADEGALVPEEDVTGLEVAVGDTAGVDVREGVSEAAAEGDCDGGAQRSVTEAVGEGVAVDELHDHERAVVLGADGVGGDDTGVSQAPEDRHFPVESVFVRSDRPGMEELHRDVLTEDVVVRLVDARRSAGSDERTQLVATTSKRLRRLLFVKRFSPPLVHHPRTLPASCARRHQTLSLEDRWQHLDLGLHVGCIELDVRVVSAGDRRSTGFS
jgi:hypothetical protein